jgi:ferredoxin
VYDRKACVRTVNGDKCDACMRKCPMKAIADVDGHPVVDELKCVGCGACEHVCPARPVPAISVKGYDMQRMVLPMSEADLLLEMKRQISMGHSLVVAHRGVISDISDGRGIAPAMAMLDSGKLKDAFVVDKIVGRAAAAIFAVGGAKKVYAAVMGKAARELLEKSGVEAGADEVVESIINREKTGVCPMECAIDGLQDAKEMVETLRKAMKR